jgi:hypothetical protein
MKKLKCLIIRISEDDLTKLRGAVANNPFFDTVSGYVRAALFRMIESDKKRIYTKVVEEVPKR